MDDSSTTKPTTGTLLVAELREKSGLPLLACKKAAVVGKGDFVKAMEYLNSGQWKFGLLIN